MGYMVAVGQCGSCKVPLTFNPDLVPSITYQGTKLPLCRDCVRRWEKIHGQKVAILPGAYEPEEVA
jgi:hypothetical protein